MPVATGSLCTGYGGLEAAVAHVLGGEVRWVADNDADVAALLAHRYPGLPNLGNIKLIDWAGALDSGALDRVRAVTGGYPCQPFSHAGRRRGTDDPRHLWPSIAVAVRALRPEFAVFENVSGHLSLGFDVVLRDLDGLGYDVWWVVVRAADIGAPHERARVFILAVRRDVVTAPAPSRFPFAILESGRWMRPQETLFGPVEYAGTFPTAGSMRDGRVYRANPPSLYRAIGLLPSPDAGGFGDKPETVIARRERELAKGQNGNGFGLTLAMTVALAGRAETRLPTPTVADSRGSRNTTSPRRDGSAHHDGTTLADVADLLPTPRAARGASGTETMYALGGRFSAADRPQGEVLLPTPEHSDGSGGRVASEFGGTRDSGAKRAVTLGTAVAYLPSPAARDWRSGASNLLGTNARPLNEIVESGLLLPSPAGYDGSRGGTQDPAKRAAGGHQISLGDRIEKELRFDSNGQAEEPADQGERGFGARNWNWRVETNGLVRDYSAAVYRWEDLTRPCPPPVVPNRKGQLRLNPQLPEWMMGLPLGWVTEVPGLTRTAQLRIAGNGVLPLQAVYALSLLVEAASLRV